MEKYSKIALKSKRYKITLIIILLIIIFLFASVFLYISLKNIIIYEKTDNTAKQVSDDVALNSSPIVIDNLIIGGVYNKRWVSADKYYMKSTKKQGIDVDVYTKEGKAGKFSLGKISKETDSLSIYTTTTRANYADEYIAIETTSSNIIQDKYKESTVSKEDIANVKKALGTYRILNSSIKIKSAYDITISDDITGKVIFVTSEKKGILGVYNACIFIPNVGKPTLIKYAFVHNSNNSDDWPIYEIKFVVDLNLDSNNELVIYEVKEFETKYSILEYKNGKFVEVLSNKTKNIVN